MANTPVVTDSSLSLKLVDNLLDTLDTFGNLLVGGPVVVSLSFYCLINFQVFIDY